MKICWEDVNMNNKSDIGLIGLAVMGENLVMNLSLIHISSGNIEIYGLN